MSKQHCRSNVRLCRKDDISTQNSFDIVAVFGNKVERCFDIVAKNGNNVEATFDIVAFDNVASTLLLVWTGLKRRQVKTGSRRIIRSQPVFTCRSSIFGHLTQSARLRRVTHAHIACHMRTVSSRHMHTPSQTFTDRAIAGKVKQSIRPFVYTCLLNRPTLCVCGSRP